MISTDLTYLSIIFYRSLLMSSWYVFSFLISIKNLFIQSHKKKENWVSMIVPNGVFILIFIFKSFWEKYRSKIFYKWERLLIIFQREKRTIIFDSLRFSWEYRIHRYDLDEFQPKSTDWPLRLMTKSCCSANF